MPRLLSLACWNVRRLGAPRDPSSRLTRLLRFVAEEPPAAPEIFALLEVEGRDVIGAVMDRFPDHRFHLSEGPQSQEILVAIHHTIPACVTERPELKAGLDFLRPGVWVTARLAGEDYTLMFLHSRAGRQPDDFGSRDATLAHLFRLLRGRPRSLVAGDFNTVGVDDPAPYSQRLDLSASDEIARLRHWSDRRGLRLCDKDAEHTLYGGSGADVDHVLVSDDLDLRGADGTARVSVLGWPQLPSNQRRRWVRDHSDHALLYCELWS